MSRIEQVTADLKQTFGSKRVLSPKDIAPIIAKSPAVQANMRSAGTFPIPIKTMGRSVGVELHALAEWLATDATPTTSAARHAPPPSVALAAPAKRQQTTRNRRGKNDWMIAFRKSITFQEELFVELERILLAEAVLPAPAENAKRWQRPF